MSTPDTQQRELASTPEASPATQPEIRIDAPHCVEGRSAEEELPGQASVVRLVQQAREAPAEEQLHLELGQLAEHLRQRQADLDRREAELNAWLAQAEQEQRAVRLRTNDCEAEVLQRHAALDEHEQEVQKRLARLAAAEAILERTTQSRQQELAEQAEIIAQREEVIELRAQLIAEQVAAHKEEVQQFGVQREQAEAELTREQQQIEARREASLALVRQALAGLERHRGAIEAEAQQRAAEASPASSAQRQEIRRAIEALDQRRDELLAGEARLAEAQDETRQLRQRLLQEQHEMQETLRAERLALAVERRGLLAEVEQKRQTVERRSAHLDQCQTSLEQLRGELGQIHRETLEIRFATEELWIQLSGAAPPARLTRSLGQIRAKLVEHYRAANDELRQQREELERIRGELGQQQQKLLKQKHLFDQWAQQRQQEIEKMAERLVAREQQLNRQDAQLADEAHGWQVERIEYQQEIRRLQVLLAAPETDLAPA